MSPGCADMAGLFIVPNTDDYQKLDPSMLESMLSEVSISGDTERNVIRNLPEASRRSMSA